MDEASRIDLSIVADPVESAWQLFPVAGGRTWLLAWRADPWPLEGGVPTPMAFALAEAFCACGWVAHSSQRVRGLRPRQGWVRNIESPAQWRHAVGPLFFCGAGFDWRGFSLTATTDPRDVLEIFDSSWSQQAEIVFLLPPGELPPVDQSALKTLFRGGPPSIFSLTGTPVLRGVVLPGVDGCAAQIVAFDPVLWLELEPALIAAATARGISVRHTTEAEALRPPPAASRSGS